MGWSPRFESMNPALLRFLDVKKETIEEVRERVTVGHTFWFLKADLLRDSTGPLERHQKLPLGWLRSCTIGSAHCRNFQLPRHVAVSYVWYRAEHPDPHGEQTDVLREWLRANKDITDVWMDWCCLPQTPRSFEEQDEFESGLASVNMVYLSCKVVKIVNLQYISRFWPQFESWLSFQAVDPQTKSFVADGSRSFEVFTGIARTDETVQKWQSETNRSWGQLNLDKRISQLEHSEVLVTNQADKADQIKKIKDLSSIL